MTILRKPTDLLRSVECQLGCCLIPRIAVRTLHIPGVSSARTKPLSGSNPLCSFLGLSGDQASSFFTQTAGGDSSTDDVKVNSRMVPNVASPHRLADSLSTLPSFLMAFWDELGTT